MQSSFVVLEAHPPACSLLGSPALLRSTAACVQGKLHIHPPLPAMALPRKLPSHSRLGLCVPPQWSQSG